MVYIMAVYYFGSSALQPSLGDPAVLTYHIYTLHTMIKELSPIERHVLKILHLYSVNNNRSNFQNIPHGIMNPEEIKNLLDFFDDNGILKYLGNTGENKDIRLYEICKDRYNQAILATLKIEAYTEPPEKIIFLDEKLDWLVREQRTLIWIREIIKQNKPKGFNKNKLSRQQSYLRLKIRSIKEDIERFDLVYRLEFIQSLPEAMQNDNITPNNIINTIAKCFDIDPNDIKSPSSLKEITLARKIAIYLIYEYTNSLTQERIGKIFNIATSWVSVSIKQIKNMTEGISQNILNSIQFRIIGHINS